MVEGNNLIGNNEMLFLHKLKTFIVIYGVVNARPYHKYYVGDVNPHKIANKWFIHKFQVCFIVLT